MPHYRQLGSMPPKRHTAHRPSPATAARASTTRKSSPRPASVAPTASSITCGRRRACRKVEPAGDVARRDASRQPTLRHHHLKTGA